jgi:hypothetical protein
MELGYTTFNVWLALNELNAQHPDPAPHNNSAFTSDSTVNSAEVAITGCGTAYRLFHFVACSH